jgi:hypothetical protein
MCTCTLAHTMSGIKEKQAEKPIESNDRFVGVCYRTKDKKLLCREIKDLEEAKEIFESKRDSIKSEEKSSDDRFSDFEKLESDTIPPDQSDNDGTANEDFKMSMKNN